MAFPNPNYKAKVQQHQQEFQEFLKFIREAGVRSYLEIGSKHGGSLWYIANTMPTGSRVVSVDLPNTHWGRSDSEESLKDCINMLRRNGYDARLFLGDSTSGQIVKEVQVLAPFDAVFIDANHTEPYVRKDFANYGRLAKICCFHDIGWNNPTPPGRLPIEVPKVWEEIKETYKDQAKFREIKIDNGHNGIGIMEWLS